MYVSDAGVPAVFKLPRGSAEKAAALAAPPEGWVAPAGLFVDSKTKDVYVADARRVVLISGGTEAAQTFADARFGQLTDVFLDAQGTLWAVDFAPPGVYKMAKGESAFSAWSPVEWGAPRAVAVSATGDVFVSDWVLGGVVKVGAFGAAERVFILNDGLSQPGGLWLNNDELHVADYSGMAAFAFAAGSSAATLTVAADSMRERPTDLGGVPGGGAVWMTQQRGGGLFRVGGGAPGADLGASAGEWADLQGLWCDCAVEGGAEQGGESAVTAE